MKYKNMWSCATTDTAPGQRSTFKKERQKASKGFSELTVGRNDLLTLRQFYTRQNVTGMSGRHRFFFAVAHA